MTFVTRYSRDDITAEKYGLKINGDDEDTMDGENK